MLVVRIQVVDHFRLYFWVTRLRRCWGKAVANPSHTPPPKTAPELKKMPIHNWMSGLKGTRKLVELCLPGATMPASIKT